MPKILLSNLRKLEMYNGYKKGFLLCLSRFKLTPGFWLLKVAFNFQNNFQILKNMSKIMFSSLRKLEMYNRFTIYIYLNLNRFKVTPEF